MSIFRPWILPIVLLGLVVCGCSHELEVTNEEDFPSVSPFESTKRGLRVALAVSGDNEMKDAIGQAIAGSLVALGATNSSTPRPTPMSSPGLPSGPATRAGG